MSVRCLNEDILPDSLPLAFRPHHADDPRQHDAASVDFAGLRQRADGRCSTPGAEDPQLMRRRRAELTPSNQDLHKAQNTQSRRRKRAERSPEDKDQANAERRVKRRYDKDSPDRRALINQSQRRRRAELTPSNKHVAKAWTPNQSAASGRSSRLRTRTRPTRSGV